MLCCWPILPRSSFSHSFVTLFRAPPPQKKKTPLSLSATQRSDPRRAPNSSLTCKLSGRIIYVVVLLKASLRPLPCRMYKYVCVCSTVGTRLLAHSLLRRCRRLSAVLQRRLSRFIRRSHQPLVAGNTSLMSFDAHRPRRDSIRPSSSDAPRLRQETFQIARFRTPGGAPCRADRSSGLHRVFRVGTNQGQGRVRCRHCGGSR